MDTLLTIHLKGISAETLINILIERDFDLFKNNDDYIMSVGIEIQNKGFIDFITNRFHNYNTLHNPKETPRTEYQNLMSFRF
jgi:hypothetical protein